MKNLLILTGSYPFEELDHFVELDLQKLHSKYNVSILPQYKSDNSTPHHKTYLEKTTTHPGFFKSTAPSTSTLIKSILYSLLCPIFLLKLFFSFIYELGFLFIFDKEQSLMFTIIRKIIKRPRPKKPLKTRLLSLVRTTGFLFYANYKLRSFKFRKYDLIYSYWGNDLSLAVAFITNKKMITRLHGYDLYKERRKDMYFAHRNLFLFRLKRIFCISELGTHYLSQNFPFLRKSKIDVSYIGSAIPKSISPRPQKQPSLSILTCSRIHPVKQLHLVAKSLKTIEFELTWHHLGSGSPAEEEKLKKYIKDNLSQKNNIKVVLHGHVETSEVLQKIDELKVDLFINSSKSEGLPISILEAMSLGVPVAAPDIGGVREAVIDEETGFLLPERVTSNRIRETIEIFQITSEEDRLKLSNNAKKLWAKEFNATKNADIFFEKVNSL
ncbi:MAG: glycosyltransferase [Bdellovibrionales bacterium]